MPWHLELDELSRSARSSRRIALAARPWPATPAVPVKLAGGDSDPREPEARHDCFGGDGQPTLTNHSVNGCSVNDVKIDKMRARR